MAQAREQWAEAGVGALVLAAAAAFLVYALSHTGGSSQRGGYALMAKFGGKDVVGDITEIPDGTFYKGYRK